MTLKAISLGNFFGRDLLARHVLALGLRPQLVHGVLAGARDRLVGRDDHALDHRHVVQRLQRHHHLRRRAVGIGDDVLAIVARHVGLEHVRVDLRHDQRHVLVVAPGRRVIDDDAALGADAGAVLLRGARARAHQADVDLGEVERREVLAFERFVAVGDLDADRAARREGVRPRRRETAARRARSSSPGRRCPSRRQQRPCSPWPVLPMGPPEVPMQQCSRAHRGPKSTRCCVR